MHKGQKVPLGQFTLEDQLFLKSIGISAMEPGREKLLALSAGTKKDLKLIEQRADGLLPIHLEADMEKDLGSNLRFFRDLENLDD